MVFLKTTYFFKFFWSRTGGIIFLQKVLQSHPVYVMRSKFTHNETELHNIMIKITYLLFPTLQQFQSSLLTKFEISSLVNE
jgi:hypothetical protein